MPPPHHETPPTAHRGEVQYGTLASSVCKHWLPIHTHSLSLGRAYQVVSDKLLSKLKGAGGDVN